MNSVAPWATYTHHRPNAPRVSAGGETLRDMDRLKKYLPPIPASRPKPVVDVIWFDGTSSRNTSRCFPQAHHDRPHPNATPLRDGPPTWAATLHLSWRKRYRTFAAIWWSVILSTVSIPAMRSPSVWRSRRVLSSTFASPGPSIRIESASRIKETTLVTLHTLLLPPSPLAACHVLHPPRTLLQPIGCSSQGSR